jgi:Fe-S-cluster containining protein
LSQNTYQTELSFIAAQALEKEEENHHFFLCVQKQDDTLLDDMVHALNDEVSAVVDCTACGNCCNTLIINVLPEEIAPLAAHLNMNEADAKEKYIEESLAGNCFINAVPCHFFAEKKCTVYDHRFKECRDFPHLHKNGARKRFLGTLLHYGNCPIIYNVVEALKLKLEFVK